MPVHERRQYIRVDDHVYIDYQIVQSGESCLDHPLSNLVSDDYGKKSLEITQYFHNIDYELSGLTQTIALKDPTIAHYINLLNAKIDYLSRQLFMNDKIQMHKINLSLGGMAFKTKEQIKTHSDIKITFYTKPKMIPIIIDATVLSSKFQSETQYHTAVLFKKLTQEQKELLSQHILDAQIRNRSD